LSVETITLGCRLNFAESEAMRALMPKGEDWVIVNSCAVTNEAVRQTRQAIRHTHRRRPSARILVTGCAAELDRGAFAAMPRGRNWPVRGRPRVQVSFGGGAQTFEPILYSLAGTPGAYAGDIIPTRSGDYIFHLSGAVASVKIDERFESGPGRFDPVTRPSNLQFPDQVGSDSDRARDIHALRDSESGTRLIAVSAVLVALAGVAIGLWLRQARMDRGTRSDED